MAKFVGKQFASIRLDRASEKEFTKWVSETKVRGFDAMERFLGDGYKVSATYVFDKSSFCVSVIGTEVTKPNQDKIMTSWSDELEEAFQIAGYKHYVICDGGDWPTQDNDAPWG